MLFLVENNIGSLSYLSIVEAFGWVFFFLLPSLHSLNAKHSTYETRSDWQCVNHSDEGLSDGQRESSKRSDKNEQYKQFGHSNSYGNVKDRRRRENTNETNTFNRLDKSECLAFSLCTNCVVLEAERRNCVPLLSSPDLTAR